MAYEMDKCPYCGKEIMKGAMRCPGCGKILKTAEEQQESIERAKQSKRDGGFGWIVKFIVIAIIVAVVGYVFYPEAMREFVDKVVGFLKQRV